MRVRTGMGWVGSLVLAASGLLTGGDVSALEGAAGSGGRVLMQVPTGAEHEYQLAIGDVATGAVLPIGKPALDLAPEDLDAPFSASDVAGVVVVSGLSSDPVVVGADGTVSDFVFDGRFRSFPRDLGDGEHYLVDDGIYARSTGEFRPLESFSADLAGWDISVAELAGDWLRLGNENDTVFVRLSDLDTVRRLPDSTDPGFDRVRANGQAVWEEDRDGASALMFADLSEPGPVDVVAREFYVVEPSVNLRGWIGDHVLAGRSELVLIDPLTGVEVRNVTAELGLPALPGGVWVIGDGPLVELTPRGADAEIVNVESGERLPHDGGRVVLHTENWMLWQSNEGFRVIVPDAGFVGEVPVGDLGEGLWQVIQVGDRALVTGCYTGFSLLVDLAALTITPVQPMCHAVATTDGAVVAGAAALPFGPLGSCSEPMVVEELGVGVVQTFPSGCPLVWLVEP